ncbi:hypothetical protein ACGFJ7_08880 [Actinoplanes sp. NPDC048988]|uniref:hypothetical protein n=1 Tax=Actinoplanes sp. NPDC048988 TaxID=3363901 RepID=UPI0037141B43
MTPEDAVQEMADRLAAVDWRRGGDKAWSRAALVKEYFRRAARWAAVYGCDTAVPFYDIAACVAPGVDVDQEVVDAVVAKVGPGNRSVRRLVPFILRWAALRGTPGVALPSDLEDPFEPLVRLFERGGGFHTENGEVNLEWVSVRMAGWRERAGDPPMNVFDVRALDEMDRVGLRAYVGHTTGN